MTVSHGVTGPRASAPNSATPTCSRGNGLHRRRKDTVELKRRYGQVCGDPEAWSKFGSWISGSLGGSDWEGWKRTLSRSAGVGRAHNALVLGILHNALNRDVDVPVAGEQSLFFTSLSRSLAADLPTDNGDSSDDDHDDGVIGETGVSDVDPEIKGHHRAKLAIRSLDPTDRARLRACFARQNPVDPESLDSGPAEPWTRGPAQLPLDPWTPAPLDPPSCSDASDLLAGDSLRARILHLARRAGMPSIDALLPAVVQLALDVHLKSLVSQTLQRTRPTPLLPSANSHVSASASIPLKAISIQDMYTPTRFDAKFLSQSAAQLGLKESLVTQTGKSKTVDDLERLLKQVRDSKVAAANAAAEIAADIANVSDIAKSSDIADIPNNNDENGIEIKDYAFVSGLDDTDMDTDTETPTTTKPKPTKAPSRAPRRHTTQKAQLETL